MTTKKAFTGFDVFQYRSAEDEEEFQRPKSRTKTMVANITIEVNMEFKYLNNHYTDELK